MKGWKFIPWLIGALALLGALLGTVPPGQVRGFDLNAFGRMPVLEGGRVKPLDSVARNSLLVIRGKQSLPYQGRTIQAPEWLADVLYRPTVANDQPAFVINDPDVLGLLGLKQSADRYFSFNTIRPHLEAIESQAQAAHALDPKERTRFQGAVVNLYERLVLYHRLQATLQLADGPEAGMAYFRPLPPPAGQASDAWLNLGEAIRKARAGSVHPGLEPLARVGMAYAGNDSVRFNAALQEWHTSSATQRPEFLRLADREQLFNRAQPFYTGMVIYVIALLALFVSWAWKRELLQPTAFALLVAGALVHTMGLAFRILLQGRPPVTNLYSSAIFVGWAAVILGAILERIYRKGFGTLVAGLAGFASLIIAHHLATEGDTMEMMRAVLDSNFWLATHVVTITIGYSGTFLAGLIAIGYTLRKHFAPTLDPETTKALVSMTYGVICFSLLFSFVGTVLGGIWADQSWGRFWGWDPKENGALLIVLWNAIILHARLGGHAQERGIMTMAIFGNVITSLSWFGVNMLGVGLHSYGFMDKALVALGGFIASQGLFMGLCLLPRRFWLGASTNP